MIQITAKELMKKHKARRSKLRQQDIMYDVSDTAKESFARKPYYLDKGTKTIDTQF